MKKAVMREPLTNYARARRSLCGMLPSLLMALTTLLVLGNTAQAQNDQMVPYQEGLHYFLIEGAPITPAVTQELSEVFSYLCTHCNTFDPYAESWKKNMPEGVSFTRVPAVFGRESWELYARGYVTAKMMNVPDEAHLALMERIWKEKEILRTIDELATFYSQFGLDRDKFLSTSRSFAVDGKLRKDQALVKAWGIRGTPSLVLNGKYLITGNPAVASYDVMFDIVDYLIGLETLAAQQASVAAD
jgi:thiol:disulfide interchange protein DsbA